MKHVLVIRPDGTIKQRSWPKGTNEQLHFLQAQVGGYIETVRTGTPGIIMIVNEEGLIRGLQYNELATRVYLEGMGASPIMGPAVLVSDAGEEFDGMDTGDANLMMGRLFELKKQEVHA